MKGLLILMGVLAGIIVLVLLIAFICFMIAFYAPRKKDDGDGEFTLPPGEIYQPFHDQMLAWNREAKALHPDVVSVTSFDGLKLYGKYYEYAPGAPIELMFHGYRGSAERDLCGGVQRCFSLGRSALVVDQRCSGKSEGRVITFGIRERRDCLSWLDYMVERFGPETEILICGISMGASTVLMAGAMELPPNVTGIIADCGYTSAREIIKKVILDMKLPAGLAYPFVKLGAWLYGGFDLEETSAIEAVKSCRVPVFFAHGLADDFVPWEMSKANYDACVTPKMLFSVPGAGHGLCYLVDPEGYVKALREMEPAMKLAKR